MREKEKKVMESRSWLLVAASHGGLLRGKGTQRGVTNPKMGQRRAWWWHWVSEHHAEVLQGTGRGDRSRGSPQGLQLTGDTRFWGIHKRPRSLWSRSMPPEGTPSQGTREDPTRSIPSPQHHPHWLFQTHNLLLYSLPSGIWYNGGFVP